MKIVINVCHGGFGVSKAVYENLVLSGMVLDILATMNLRQTVMIVMLSGLMSG